MCKPYWQDHSQLVPPLRKGLYYKKRMNERVLHQEYEVASRVLDECDLTNLLVRDLILEPLYG